MHPALVGHTPPPPKSSLSLDKGAAAQEPFIPSFPSSCISKAELEGPFEGSSPRPKYLGVGVTESPLRIFGAKI